MAPHRVLVVDDEEDMRTFYRRLFANRGAGEFAAEVVEDAERALESLKSRPADLLVLDWSLPGVSGPALAKALRRAPPTRAIGILMVTAKSAPADAVSALDAGADDHLAKPFVDDVLLARLRSLARRRALGREGRELEERLLHAQRSSQLGRLALGVAHDFNALLSIILGCTSFIKGGPRLSEQQARDLDAVADATRQGAELVQLLSDFGRADLSQPPRCGLNETVRRAERLLGCLLRRKGRLRVELAPGLGDVAVARGRLEQVLLNLAVNARDAMTDGGVLTLRTAPAADPGFALLEVSDDGRGMPAEVRSRLFEPYFTTKAPGHGTGLGLATVRDLIVQAGGRISVESEPGAGAVFRIELPRA